MADMDMYESRCQIAHAVNLKLVHCKAKEEDSAAACNEIIVDKKELTSRS
jgi:hypothetical protein